MAAEPEHALATLGEVLLTPTRIYARALLAARASLLAAGQDVRGIAHITGGGLPGNVPRALPAELGARLDPLRWRMPSVMRLVGALGGLGDDEIRATFNGGLGMVVVVAPAAIDATVTALRDAGLEAAVVGEVVAVGPARRGPLRGGRDRVTEWSGVVATQYGTIMLAEPKQPPAEDLEFDRLLGREGRCRSPEASRSRCPTRAATFQRASGSSADPPETEDEWEHVAEIGIQRISVAASSSISWMPDEDLAAEIDVPTEALVARIHWAGLGEWLRHVERT